MSETPRIPPSPGRSNEIESLVALLGSQDPDVRREGCRELLNHGYHATGALLYAADHAGGRAAAWAVYTLGLIGDQRALETLKRMTQSEDAMVRKWAWWACREIECTNSLCPSCNR